jgi:hypothetical protein
MAVSVGLVNHRWNPVRLGSLVACFTTIALMLPLEALAGKNPKAPPAPAWITLVRPVERSSQDGEPHLGSTVSFATGYPADAKNPWVSLFCYQDGSLVYAEGGSPSSAFLLGGATSDWAAAGGAASCRAELGDLYWRGGRQHYTYFAQTSFEAAA